MCTAYLLTGDWHTAEDLVQNTLAGLLVSWRRVRDDVGNLDAYVHRCLVNARARWWRRRWLDPLPMSEVPEPRPRGEGVWAPDDGWLVDALQALSQRQRAVVVLRHCEDLSEQEVAEILGCTVGTVKTHGSRGLARLRAMSPPDRGRLCWSLSQASPRTVGRYDDP